MKSKEDIEMYRDMAQDVHRSLKILSKLTLIDLGEDEGFEDIADGLCGGIYDAEEDLDNIVGGLNEILDTLEG